MYINEGHRKQVKFAHTLIELEQFYPLLNFWFIYQQEGSFKL